MMKRFILYAVILVLMPLASQAQEVYRTFDYQSPELTPTTVEAKVRIAEQLRQLQDHKLSESARAARIIAAYEANDKAALKLLKVKAADVDPNRLSNTVADTIVLETEKLAIVSGAMDDDKEQLAAVGKALVDEGNLFAAEAVLRTLQDKHPQYAYTHLLAAYYSQALGVVHGRATDNLSRQNKMNELNAAAAQFEELSESAKDSLDIYRELLFTAGSLRYEAQEEAMCRTDFEQVLRLHPSAADSIDIAVMLAYFDRVQAAEALRNGDAPLALEYYDKSLAGYGSYILSSDTLPRDVYTADAIEGFLFCKSNRAALQRQKNPKDISGYRDLLKDTERFLAYRSDDIKPHRYKLSAYFQMCMADSTQFSSLRREYEQSMAYITDGQFADSLYTYDDYNMAQQGATWLGDDAMRAKYIRKCIDTYRGESGEVKGNLMAALINSEMRAGNHKAEIQARKALIAEVLKNAPAADISTNELNLAKAYFNVIAAEKEKTTLPLDSIYYYAEQGNAILDKYINSANEDYAANAAMQRYNGMIDLLALADDSVSNKYYAAYREEMLRKIDWSKQNDVAHVQNHVSNLFRITYNYILNCKTASHLPAIAGEAYSLFFRQFEAETDEDIRLETATAYLGNINRQLQGRIYELKPGEDVFTAVCDTVDRYMLLMNHGTATDPTLQQEAYRFFTEVRENYLLGNVSDAYLTQYERARFLTNHTAIQTKGHTSYLAELIRRSNASRFYHESIVNKHPDLTDAERTLAYSALAQSFFSKAAASYDQYIAGKTASLREAALDDFQWAYYYAVKAQRTGYDKAAGYINTLESVNFARPAIEKARETLAQEEAPAPSAAPQTTQTEKE